jgi:hypothetical protein
MAECDEVLPECAAKLASIEATQETHGKLLERIVQGINGNGGPGMKTRLDRLEQVEKNRKWAIRTLAAAVIGILTRIFYGMFK